jgi:hypothetical protein
MFDPNTAISMARMVCAGLDANQTVPVLALSLRRDTNLTPRQIGYFIGLSVASYCPQYNGRVDSSVDIPTDTRRGSPSNSANA